MTQDAMQPFLISIEQDRDQQIARIQAEADTEIKRICDEAHTRAQQLQRDTNERLKQELSVRRHQEISRVEARIRRKRWQSLKKLQHNISEQVLERMRAAWAEPEWQWNWCHFWLQAMAEKIEEHPVRVAIDRIALPETIEQINQWAEKNGLRLSLVEPLDEPGLVIYWLDFELEGLISAQGKAIEAAVLARLTPLLPRSQP